MDYRTRIYKRYASNVQGQGEKIDLMAADRWGRSYDIYLRDWLPAEKNAAILEVGCGYGRLLRFFSERGYTNITGVDISPEQVELARKVHRNVVETDALKFLKAHTDEFDLIIGLDIIEHFHKDEVVCFLDTCHNALKMNGRLVIQTPNADSPFGLMHRYNDFTHETCFNLNAIARLMRVCGFTAIEGREQRPVPHGLLSFFRWLLWKFIRLLLLTYNIIETGTPGSGIFTRVFIISGIKTCIKNP